MGIRDYLSSNRERLLYEGTRGLTAVTVALTGVAFMAQGSVNIVTALTNLTEQESVQDVDGDGIWTGY